nr:MAG TPA: hypothetical protein [Caudoviricetes sp.]DAT75359.1 MAG TPA: hypothetical protein [Caudoviricetes sp.]
MLPTLRRSTYPKICNLKPRILYHLRSSYTIQNIRSCAGCYFYT